MEDFRQKRTIEKLEKQVDELHKEVHTMKQQQVDMLEQIKLLKWRLSDGSGK